MRCKKESEIEMSTSGPWKIKRGPAERSPKVSKGVRVIAKFPSESDQHWKEPAKGKKDEKTRGGGDLSIKSGRGSYPSI